MIPLSEKKNPARFNIQFDSSISEHQKVIQILSSKGRNTARYIADAVLAYGSSLTDRIETAVTNALNNVLHQGSLKLENRNETEDFEFDEISDALDGFRK